uniref:SPRY domain-containing protein n=1 Tax=Eucampia antarctica TaxID=49252 RepID=A0A7S2SGK5_9STRA|mmetsp:Transcript_7619/g.7172  ORF Transcript_7619/g.7172 Transcript_7619/m.7172 type:complete len:217 (+) Transcript_7619:282-932(+)|eukprot:CAMPEP_0197835388 /NCGR_PEP_ID=MMETSP1437-20131217/25585_1 /TAXON_ID=49252 ORGANISM="Eucampia antarctica, Strain CCMP1452" /NCGR_SAMPLE_ID=MMETSP1437 /ASSEMBLY_ACC=CAM_ASM_001096 /LENGTH=216 /DNA_ID=CAMNT_0043440769 /DNA_START=259 /DNA_END=909 /DNA_ORIENTATION=-
MGGCCSCFGTKETGNQETEMTSRSNGAESNGVSSLTIARHMTAPSVEIENARILKGSGLALVGVTVEQDAAYWEWHVESLKEDGPPLEDDEDPSNALMFGVATMKNPKFYRAMALNEDSDTSNAEDGTALMKPITELRDGDTVGVAVQQSDLPMIQFFLNGEPLHELAINRFRGAVYPSIYMREGFKTRLVLDENEFKEMSPHARFGPLIAARGII